VVADPFSPGSTIDFPFTCSAGFLGQLIPECGATYESKSAADLNVESSSNIPAALGRTFGTAPATGSCPSTAGIIEGESPSVAPAAGEVEPTNTPIITTGGAGNTESPDDSSAVGHSLAARLACQIGAAMMGILIAF
jgi:hypothetical protein